MRNKKQELHIEFKYHEAAITAESLINCCTINGRAGMLENFVATTLEDFYQLPEDVTEIVQIILTLLASDLSIGKRTVV